MKKIITFSKLLFIIFLLNACKKNDTTSANPLAPINGNWVFSTWCGTANNPLVLAIDQTTANGTVKSIAAVTCNYTTNEIILSAITATSNALVFNCNAIFKYGSTNQNTATTTATITLQSNNTQILIHYAAAAGIQPPDFIYTKQ